jgi:hypothetical protein
MLRLAASCTPARRLPGWPCLPAATSTPVTVLARGKCTQASLSSPPGCPGSRAPRPNSPLASKLSLKALSQGHRGLEFSPPAVTHGRPWHPNVPPPSRTNSSGSRVRGPQASAKYHSLKILAPREGLGWNLPLPSPVPSCVAPTAPSAKDSGRQFRRILCTDSVLLCHNPRPVPILPRHGPRACA